MTMRLPFACTLLLAAAPLLADAARIAVLPLAESSASREVTVAIGETFATTLQRRGWEVAPASEIETFLEGARIRHLDSLSARQFEALREGLRVDAVVVGSVLTIQETGNDPQLGIAARLIGSGGEVSWGNVVALSSAETERAFATRRRNTIEALARTVTARLLARFPRPDRDSNVRLAKTKSLSGPVTYRAAAHPKGSVRRVCVLPFASSLPDASRVLLAILTVRLEATGEFDVVEPAELREAMRAAGLRSIGSLTSSELATLANHLGTTTFLRGNVHTFRDAPAGRSEIQLDMTLADVERGQVLWAATHQRRGSDYDGLLGRGTVGNAAALADRVLSEAIESQHRTRPRASRDLSSRKER
jgi:TolB-like protein